VCSSLGRLAAAEYRSPRGRRAVDGVAALAARWVALPPDRRRDGVADLARTFLRVARLVEPDVSVEVGAKDARFSRRIVEAVPGCEAIAFEANPHTYRRFTDEVGASGVSYTQTAIADRVGRITFHVRRRADGRARADGQGSLLLRGNSSVETEPISVAATTLDRALADRPGRLVLWIDAEGATGLILAGGSDTLARAAAVLLEVEDRELWRGQATRASVVSELRRHDLHPVARDRQSRLQYNVVFLAGDLVDDPGVAALVHEYRRRDRSRLVERDQPDRVAEPRDRAA
jgi:FkbM family methyltransferase